MYASITANSPAKGQDIVKKAQARFRYSFYLDLRRIECIFAGGVLTLKGIVPSYHMRQMAQALVQEMAGIARIDNQLEVMPSRHHPHPCRNR